MKRFKKPTTLRTHFRKLVNDLNDNFRGIGEEFDGVHQRIDELYQLRKDFYELRDEIATNGVVRDLVKLRKDHQELRENTTIMVQEFHRKFDDLAHNGVATDIRKLNAEVFDKKVDSDTSGILRAMYTVAGMEPEQKVTLRGKIDAIIEHLGIDVSVKPREVIESEIVTKKVKKTKKGKK